MIYKKPFLSYDEQVKLLHSRGLMIKNPEKSALVLKQTNYYRFSAYALPFQKTKDQFNPGTSFEVIVKLYEMDRFLRINLISWLEKLEIALRAFIGYFIAETYGPFGYAESKTFSPGFRHSEWMDNLNKEKYRSAETFIKHFTRKYTESPCLPIWMATEIMSMGSLSFLVKGLRKKDQKILAGKILLPVPVFSSWMHSLTYIRNLCAHHSRIWNRELAIKPVVPEDDSWIFLKGRNDRIFAIFSVITYYALQFKLSLNIKNTLTRIKEEYSAFPFDVFRKMGFPEKYNRLWLWEEKKENRVGK